MSRRRRNHVYSPYSYGELLAMYREFTLTVGTGGARCAGRAEADELREIEAELRRREATGDTGGTATLTLGGVNIDVMVKR